MLSWLDDKLATLGEGFIDAWSKVERSYRRPSSRLASRLQFAFYPLLALGAIAGFAQGQTGVGFDATALDTYRQGISSSVSQSSTRVLDRFLNLLPTVTIREGHRIKVDLSSDLALPAYRDPLRVSGGRP